LRAKGTDFDQPQWYARRFKRPPPEGLAEGSPAAIAGLPR
jgi:hypothetical protein